MESARIELASPVCRTGVLPLNYDPEWNRRESNPDLCVANAACSRYHYGPEDEWANGRDRILFGVLPLDDRGTGAPGRNRASVSALNGITDSLSAHSVDSAGIEPASQACKAYRLPLTYEPKKEAGECANWGLGRIRTAVSGLRPALYL